jgi:hypothetical protein
MAWKFLSFSQDFHQFPYSVTFVIGANELFIDFINLRFHTENSPNAFEASSTTVAPSINVVANTITASLQKHFQSRIYCPAIIFQKRRFPSSIFTHHGNFIISLIAKETSLKVCTQIARKHR